MFTRRSFFRGAGAVGLLTLSSKAVLARPLGANPFQLGVAAGDPWPDGFVIWTRLCTVPLAERGGIPAARIPVRWEVAEDENFQTVVQSGEELALPELSHSVHVELTGLRPHRHYWYRFATAGSDVSPVGKARTAPALHADVSRLQIAVGGCQNFEHGYFGAWRHAGSEADLDLIYHYGDYIYEGTAAPLSAENIARGNVRAHHGDEIYSIDDYRRRYAQYKSDPDLQFAHQSAAFLASFDDHEVDNNWANDIDQDETDPAIFRLRRAMALQAWYENMPVRRAQFPQGGGVQMFRRLHYGSLLQMHILDTRSYRSDQPCEQPGEKGCVAELDGCETMLGDRQEQWLTGGLGNKQAHWNLIAMQSLIMPLDRSNQRPDHKGKGYDTWTGYEKPRARMIDNIQQQQLTNVVFTGGDSHLHFAGHLPQDPQRPESAPVATEFHATSIASRSGNGHPIGPDPRVDPNPHLNLLHDQRGYLLFDISPKNWVSHLRVVDNARNRDCALDTIASFSISPNRPIMHQI